MIIETLRNDGLETREKMMILLYHLGMADRHRLASLLHLSVHTIDQTIKRLNKKNPNEKHIISYSAPFNKGPKLYQLGPSGWKWMMEWNEEDRKYYQRSEAQRRHYNGMTDVLIRLMEHFGRDEAFERIEYLNTYDASELFFHPWAVINWEAWQDHNTKKEHTKGLPKPDIYLQIDDQGYWGEYDTSYEIETKVKAKYRRYFRAFNQLGVNSQSRKAIIWIAPTRSRANRMKDWLNQVENELEFSDMKNPPPEMIFVAEGEELDYLLSQHSKKKEEKIKMRNI